MAKMKGRITLAAMTLVQAIVVRAEAPTVTSVEPAQVFADEATTVTIRGAGFSADSRVGLLDASGPHIVAVVSTPGVAQDVAVEGNLAYVADGNGLVVVDVADPSRPRVLSRLPLDDASRVAGLGQVVLVGGSRTLNVVDLSNPSLPVLAATLDLGPIAIAGLEAAEGHAYVLTQRDGLLTVDVRDPSTPVVAHRIPGDAFGALPVGFARDGDALHVLLAQRQPQGNQIILLHVFDLADPGSPRHRVRGFVVENNARGVWGFAASRGRVYASIDGVWDGIRIVDVRDLPVPSPLGFVPNALGAIVSDGDDLYVARDVVTRIDVSDPAAPKERGRCGGVSYPIAVADDHVLAQALENTGQGNGLAVVDFEDPAGVVARLRVNSYYGVARTTSGAVATFSGRDLEIFDIAQPSEPRRVGTYRFTDGLIPDAVSWSGDYLRRNASDGITEGRSNESVVDLADPAAPRLVLSRDESSREAPTVLSAGRAYWERSRLIFTVDLGTSPQAPSVWSCPDEFDWFQPMAAAGSTLFGAGAERGGTRGGVFVLELDEPGGVYGEGPAPPARVVSLIALPFGPHDLVLRDGLLFVLGYSARVVYDVSDPSKPFAVPDPLAAWISPRLEVVDGRAAATWIDLDDGGIGLDVDRVGLVDLRDPLRPWISGDLRLPAEVTGRSPSIAGGVVVLDQKGIAGRAPSGGVTLLRLPPTIDPPDVVSPTELRLEVPAEFTPGEYHVRITNGEPEAGVLYAALRVCARKPFDATLSPVSLPTAPVRPLDPIRWRLALDGDPAFFGDPPGHRASLALPPLPATLTTRFEPGDGSGRMSIEILVGTGADLGEVVLTGDDRAAIEALWSAIRDASGISLSPLDDRRYGDMTLEVHEGNAWANAAGAPRGPAGAPSPAAHPGPVRRYRYEFAGGRLDAARAWGPGVDLIFEAGAVDGERCEFPATASFLEARRAPCEGLGAARRSERAAVCGP